MHTRRWARWYVIFMDVTTKKGNEVVDDEHDNVRSSGCAFHTPYFPSVSFDACLVSEGVWVLRNILTPLLRLQSPFKNIGELSTLNKSIR